jgi:hypothetical protein
MEHRAKNMTPTRLSAKGKGLNRIANLKLRNADLNLVLKDPIKTRSIIVSLNPKFEIRNPKLFNDFICSRQHIRGNGESDLLGRFEIDEEFKLHRLLDGQFRRVGTL